MLRALLRRVFGSIEYRSNRIRTWYWSRLCGAWGAHSNVYGPITVNFPERLRMGSHSCINTGALLQARGGITIGDWVHISSYAILNSSTMDFNAPRDKRPGVRKPIVIQDGAWIASGAILNPGVTIGEDAVIGPGAVVTRDVPARTVVTLPASRSGLIRAPEIREDPWPSHSHS